MPAPLARFLFGRQARRAAVPSRTARLRVDRLEDRTAPANLRNPEIQLLDGNNIPSALLDSGGQAVFTTVVGGQVRIRANWLTDDLSDQNKYFIRVNVNGIDLDSAELTGTGGKSVRKR